MTHLAFRMYTTADEAAVLALNHDSVEATSPLDAQKLALLRQQGCQITVATAENTVVGFLMVFNEGSDYDSVNYQWFDNQFKRFAYVDRIVIAAAARGTGAGQQFYCGLKKLATAQGRRWIAAEINVEPPNEISLVFHRKQSFVEIGRQAVGSKLVSMQVCELE